jgi:tetratricopeptide (TPR) repeat protein
VDSQTRHALKQDKFVQTTQSGVDWVGSHRTSVIRFAIAVVVMLALIISGIVYYTQRSSAGENALGMALDVYTASLAQPGAPVQKGTYTNAGDRAKEANREFVAISKDYGWLGSGTKAHYFAGITYQDLGQNGPAETELKSAADSFDGNLSSLAKFSLAGLYHRTNRDAQAIDLYNGLIAKPTNAVPAYTSQLALADLYASSGKLDQAKAIWAKVKDADKTGSAGSIAAEKLTPKK